MKNLIFILLLSLSIFGQGGSPTISLEYGDRLSYDGNSLNKFGRNIDIDAAASEDIWDAGGTWPEWATAGFVKLISTSANDTIGGTGLRTVAIFGLNQDTVAVSDTLTLLGTDSTAASNNRYIIVYRMFGLTAGSGGVNAGNITATNVSTASVGAQISTGYNQTLMAIYMVEKGHTLFLKSYYASMNRSVTSGSADIFLWTKSIPGVWRLRHIIGTVGAGASHFRHPFEPHLKVGEKILIRIEAAVTANNTDISAGFDGYVREEVH